MYTYKYVFCSTEHRVLLDGRAWEPLECLQNSYGVSMATGGVNRFPRDDVQGTLDEENKNPGSKLTYHRAFSGDAPIGGQIRWE